MALECFRHCFLRLSFWTVESRELLDYENLIFLFFCSAMILGMCVAPLLKRLLCKNENSQGAKSSRSATALFRFFLLLAIPLTVVGYFSKGPFALALDFITVIMVSGAMSLCLDQVVLFVRVGETGRFIGICFAVMATLGNILFFLPFYEVSTHVSLVIVCVVLLIALLAFPRVGNDQETVSNPVEDDWILEPFPQKDWIQKAIIVVGLYAIIAGMLDNLYFFDDAFSMIPNFLFYILLYSSIIDLLAGYLFDKGKWFAVILGAFLCICLGQSMSFFSSNALLIFPYTVLSTAGSITLEVFLVSLPLIYCKKRRQGWIFPGLGNIFMYGGFLITSIFFEAVPMIFALPTLGILLIVSLLAVVFIFILRLELVVYRTETVLDAFTSGKNRTAAQVDYLTEQERKILNRLLELEDEKVSAESAGIAESAGFEGFAGSAGGDETEPGVEHEVRESYESYGAYESKPTTGANAADIASDLQMPGTGASDTQMQGEDMPEADAEPGVTGSDIVTTEMDGDVSVSVGASDIVASGLGTGVPNDTTTGVTGAGKLFSSVEQEIAPLLCQGYTQFEIARHLHIDVAIVKERIHDIRDKIVDQTTGANERMLSVMSEKYGLTTRERQMLYGIYNGKSNVEIAAELFVSEATIKFHVRNLLKKLSVENRYQVAELLRTQGH